MKTKDFLEGEIETVLMEDVLRNLPKISTFIENDNCLLIHGLGGQTKKLYRELERNQDIEVLWFGWFSNIFWTKILSFIPGQSGLIKVKNKKNVDSLFLMIGKNSMCNLYFVPESKEKQIFEDVVKTRGKNIREIISSEKNYFILSVDFDYKRFDEEELSYRAIQIGEELDTKIEENLLRTRKYGW